MSLAEICENAKMAREYALLGNYDTSLVYYQGVIQQIQKHIQQLKDDAIMKQEWHQVGCLFIVLEKSPTLKIVEAHSWVMSSEISSDVIHIKQWTG